ncbi:hypothetical protein NBRC10513_000853 [Rhodotorula toruloides]
MPDLSLSSPPGFLAGSPCPNSSERTSDAFFRDVQLCPDGSCLLATAEDRSLSLFPLTDEQVAPEPSTSSATLSPVWTHSPPDSLISSAWYPGASSADPAMFTFAVGVKDHPVHLLDGNDRRVRASYPIVDHTERFVAPHSMAFSPDGSRLCCGFENAFEIFDVSQPGAEGYRLHTTPTRSSRQGQKGIISSLAFSPPDSSSNSLLAAGSFSGSVGLYDISSPTPLTHLLQPSQHGGVTKLLFHPLSPHLLFVASRQSTHLDVWDLRNTSRTSSSGKLSRKGRTNQRLGFDIDPSGTWLAAGDQDGNLSVFSAQPLPDQLEPVTTFSLSSEPISTALFHPFALLLITTSGARKFGGAKRARRDTASSSESDSSDEEDGANAGAQDDGLSVAERNSLEIWRLS